MSTAREIVKAEDATTMQKICELLNEIDICLIWHKGQEADLQRRPMTRYRNHLADGLWFFSQRSPRLETIYGNSPHVTVAVSSPVLKQCAALLGHASIVDHKPSLAYFNVKANEQLLPAGVAPGQLVLLKIDVKQMDLWEWKSGTLVHSSSLIPDLTVTDQLPTTDGQRSQLCN